MRKVTAAINVTLDGVCDHTAINADDELHQHYADLLRTADVALYGRTTYQLMEYWKTVAENPTGDKATDEFAGLMDKLPKIVFSKTLNGVNWQSARIADLDLKSQVGKLKQQPGKSILVGSRSLIMQLLKLRLVDEFQLCVHPVIAGSGLQLFEDAKDRLTFQLRDTKSLASGAIVLYYQPVNN